MNRWGRRRGDCLCTALLEMRPKAIHGSEVETAGDPAGGGRNAECLALRRGLCRLNYSDHQTSTAGQRGKPAAEAPINSLVSPRLFCWQNTLVLSPNMAQHWCTQTCIHKHFGTRTSRACTHKHQVISDRLTPNMRCWFVGIISFLFLNIDVSNKMSPIVQKQSWLYICFTLL